MDRYDKNAFARAYPLSTSIQQKALSAATHLAPNTSRRATKMPQPQPQLYHLLYIAWPKLLTTSPPPPAGTAQGKPSRPAPPCALVTRGITGKEGARQVRYPHLAHSCAHSLPQKHLSTNPPVFPAYAPHLAKSYPHLTQHAVIYS